MDRPGHDFFADTTLAAYQDRRPLGSNLKNLFFNRFHRTTGTNNLTGHLQLAA